MDTNRIREITVEIERLEDELKSLVGGDKKERKPVSCSICGGQHTARTCDKKTE